MEIVKPSVDFSNFSNCNQHCSLFIYKYTRILHWPRKKEIRDDERNLSYKEGDQDNSNKKPMTKIPQPVN